ncbi:SCO family protein [Natribaculum luteum]|uniref:SCO family protein n=1 Tax=Natribaculum luteum TaxID=1586232 RepID=A0ABD5P447_9EURY|nr:SCO family protein [Natribaculum luteum]
MQRRTFLRLGAAGGAVAASGCLTSLVGDDGTENVVLGPQEDQLADSEDLAYPAYGQAFPDFSLPDPLAETTIDTTELEDQCLITTAFYTFCPAECVSLISTLAGLQAETIDRDLVDDVTFLAISFDPERDTPAKLRENAEIMRVDLEAGNWHYLLPEEVEEARAVVDEKLGIAFQKDSEVEGYEFSHNTLTFLSNPDDYVERAYTSERPDIDRMIDDIETVLSNWE